MNKTYCAGDRVYLKFPNSIRSIEEYLVAQIGYNKICLVNIDDGKYWCTPIEVEDVRKISQKEMDIMLEEVAELVTKEEYEKYLKE